jgi:hypothetical protein
MEITKQFFLPEEYRDNFYVEDFLKIKEGYKLLVFEKTEKIPKELEGKETVLNGFLNPITLIDHPVKAELMHLEIHRRRWKESGTTEGFSNSYDLNPKGCKLTKGFGDFFMLVYERYPLGKRDYWTRTK